VKRPTPAAASTTGGGTRRKLFGTVCAGLLAGALYLSAAASASAATCPNEAVRIQQAAQDLANCRAYEMVSPLDKENGDVQTIIESRAAPDGEALEYEANTAFADSEGSSHANQYVSRRGPNGWSTESLNPFQTPDPAAWLRPRDIYAMTSDLTKGVLVTNHDPNDRNGPLTEDQKRLYLWTQGGGYLAISPPALEKPFLLSAGPLYAGSTPDMDRIFFESEVPLLPEAPPYTNEVYEWHNGLVQIVSRMENGEVAPEGATAGGGAAETGGIKGAISGDGSQIVLSSGSWFSKQLYLRENGETKLISASQVEGEVGTPAPEGATYMGSASLDGQKLSTIFFASPDLLTDDAEGEPFEAGANELYAYDVGNGKLRLLSINTSGDTGVSASVYPYWVGSSDDGDYVYFIAGHRLTPEAASTENIYLWHDGVVQYLGPAGSPRPNETPFNFGIAQVSADGTRLAYIQDVRFANETLVPGGPTNVNTVYLYDATTDKWTCASCNPNGPTTQEGQFGNFTAGFSGADSIWYARRNLLADGSRLYFETAEALVPGDTNGARDVYEWHGDQINLISPGRGAEGAHFLDASADGRDVFIGTRERLAPQDTDDFVDAYDAREGGGFLYEGPLKPCEGDSCQVPSSSAPAAVAPGSASVVGGGNVKRRRAARCPKPHKAKAKKGAKGKRAAKNGRARVAKAKQRCVKQAGAKKHKAHSRHRAHRNGQGDNR
jgi:hypothetical protein